MRKADPEQEILFKNDLRDVMKELKEKTGVILHELTYLYIACALDEELPSCSYCDIPCEADTYFLEDSHFNVVYFGAVLRYIIALVPLLTLKKEYERANNMLRRTNFYFQRLLKDTKRLAFIANLLINSQYEIDECKNQLSLIDECKKQPSLIERFVDDSWNSFKCNITLNVNARNYVDKTYFYFAALFMADIFLRFDQIGRCKSLLNELDELHDEHFNEHNDFGNCCLKPLREYLKKKAQNQRCGLPCFYMNESVQFRIFMAFGYYRLDKTIIDCRNQCTCNWNNRLRSLVFNKY